MANDKYEMTVNVISALASDIRGYWGCGVYDRVTIMAELCEQIDHNDWATELLDNISEISSDGRWLRGWEGPYGDTTDIKTLNELGIDPCVFASPEIYIEGYDM